MSVKKSMSLHGRKAFVTGSSEGIGKAIVMALAEQGSDVIIHARSNASGCRKLKEQIETEFNVHCEFVLGDLSDITEVDRIVDDVTKMGAPDILVLNASVQVRKPFLEITHEEFTTQCMLNFWSTLRIIQLLYPSMEKKRWGRILTIGSVQQQKPHKDMAVYAATKSAIMNMVTNLALQFAAAGVTINNLAPGVITTRRNEEALADDAYSNLVRSKIPVGFFGEATDCAPIAALLCSNAARFITGQNIFCDGGMTL